VGHAAVTFKVRYTVEEITRALIDRLLVAQKEFDRELYTGFSHSRRDNNRAELEEAKETLMQYVQSLDKQIV
jgi:hypothetical protein